MMNTKRRAAIFAAAIFISLSLALVSYTWLQNSMKRQYVMKQPVAVATIDLPWGTTLNREMIKCAPYLKESLPAGHFSNPAALEGRILLYPVRANEPIFESRLAPSTMKAGGIAALVSPNKRAMAVKVDKVIGVSGFIHPGNRVDVLVSLAQNNNNTNIPITKTVLENILVLATGAQVEQAGKQEKPAEVDVITMEVAPDEGEKLALAATQGKLQLVLRNCSDTQDVRTRGVTIPTLLSSYSPSMPAEVKKKAPKPKPVIREKIIIKEAAVMPQPPKTPAISVELVQGGKITQMKFERGI